MQNLSKFEAIQGVPIGRRIQIATRLKPIIFEELTQLASEQSRTVSSMIEFIIIQYLQETKKQHDINNI